MSAYMVAQATIDALVAAAKQYPGKTGPGWSFYTGDMPIRRCEFTPYASDEEAENDVFNADTLGRMLWQENLLSVHSRYPDTEGAPEVAGSLIGEDINQAVADYRYPYGANVVEVDPIGMFGVIRGYVYQACEHREWRNSVAHAFCRQLRDNIIDHLISRQGAAAWTVDAIAEVGGPTGAVSLSEMMVHKQG